MLRGLCAFVLTTGGLDLLVRLDAPLGLVAAIVAVVLPPLWLVRAASRPARIERPTPPAVVPDWARRSAPEFMP